MLHIVTDVFKKEHFLRKPKAIRNCLLYTYKRFGILQCFHEMLRLLHVAKEMCIWQRKIASFWAGLLSSVLQARNLPKGSEN